MAVNDLVEYIYQKLVTMSGWLARGLVALFDPATD